MFWCCVEMETVSAGKTDAVVGKEGVRMRVISCVLLARAVQHSGIGWIVTFTAHHIEGELESGNRSGREVVVRMVGR